MANATETIAGVVVVALFLIVGGVVYGQIHSTQRTNSLFIQGPVVNGSLGTLTEVPLAFTAANYPIVPNTTYVEKVYVGNSTGYDLLTNGVNYTVAEETGVINITSYSGDAGNERYVNMTYEYYGGDGYDALEEGAEQTYNGFELGALIPYIMFAALILGIVMAAFYRR